MFLKTKRISFIAEFRRHQCVYWIFKVSIQKSSQILPRVNISVNNLELGHCTCY